LTETVNVMLPIIYHDATYYDRLPFILPSRRTARGAFLPVVTTKKRHFRSERSPCLHWVKV